MKSWIIIKREYREIVRKRSFLISTILTPALMIGLMYLPVLLSKVAREEKIIEIMDFSGSIQTHFMTKCNSDKELNKQLRLTFRPAEQFKKEQKKLLNDFETPAKFGQGVSMEITSELKKKILDKKIHGLLIIPENVRQNRMVYFFAINVSDFETHKYITSSIQKILCEQILVERSIAPDVVKDATADVSIGTYKVKKEGTSSTSSKMEYLISIFMLSILFSVILGYGQLTMRGVMEEKNNRIIEVLISSTDAISLFWGKVIGIGLAGLTQVGLWIILGGLFASQSSLGIDAGILNFLNLELALYFCIFFIIGYFMYAVIFSVVGASVNTDQEAQQFSAPIIYLLLIPFFFGMMITQSPDSPVFILASLFPFFTPMLMFMRITISMPPFYQIATSIALSVITTVFMAWVGAKIFRVGILMYGKKPSLKEMIHWSRYK